MGRAKDPAVYAENLFEALADPDQAERFELADAELDGEPVAFLTCDGKPVAVVLPEGLDTLTRLFEAAGDGEDEGEEEDDEDPRGVVEGFVVRRGPAKKPRRAGFKP